jgi:hypothetical protein
MNKLTAVIALFLLCTSLCYSQYAWTGLIFHYQSGTVPPPYHYSYDLSIKNEGVGYLTYSPGYSGDTAWNYNINIDKSSINKLNDEIQTSKVLLGSIQSLPSGKQPIGGSLQNLTIIISDTNPNADHPPLTIVTPYFPTQYKEALDSLYDSIKELVPQSIWDEIDQNREVYIKNHSK